MGSNCVGSTMKCVAILGPLLAIIMVKVASEEEEEINLYPYPIRSNGSHVCRINVSDQGLMDPPCEWMHNDNFTEYLIAEIKKNIANETSEDDEQGIVGGVFNIMIQYFTGCFPYCQGPGQQPWIE